MGQNGVFVHDLDRYLEVDGEAVLYGPGWEEELPANMYYLHEIMERGDMPPYVKVYLPCGGPGMTEYVEYAIHFTAVDEKGSTNDSVIVLRVRFFAERTFTFEVTDEHENTYEASATLTWRGLYSDAAEVIAARRAGTTAEPLAHHFPNSLDGLLGVRFVHSVIESGRGNGKWVEC